MEKKTVEKKKKNIEEKTIESKNKTTTKKKSSTTKAESKKTVKATTKSEPKKTAKTTTKTEAKKTVKASTTKAESKKTVEATTKTEPKKTVKTRSTKVETKKAVKDSSPSLTEKTSEVTKEKKEYIRNNYYMFKMNPVILNGLSLVIIVFCCLVFYLIYGSKSLEIINDNIVLVIVLYLPYIVLHELLHSLAYVIYGADFKNITYGVHLEKGILCCLCKKNIDKRNILHSLLYPFIIIGVITLIIGILVNYPLLVILSLINISGCSGDLVMYYHLSKLDNYSFSEYNNPIAFALYTKEDFSKLKMFGLDYAGKKANLDRNDLRKVVISKPSIIILIIFYALIILNLVA